MPSLPQSDHAGPNGRPFDLLLRPLPGLKRRAASRPRTGAALVAAMAGAIALPVVTASAAGASDSSSSESLQQTVKQAVTSMEKAGSGHVVITADRGGQHSAETIDLGSNGGTATVVEAGKVLHILYTHHTVYLQAKPDVLTTVIGMPAKLAQKYGGKWLSSPSSQGGIAQLVQLFSLKTYATGLVNLSGPLTKASSTSTGGKSVIAVHGTIPKTSFNQGSGAGSAATLLVTTAKPHYPVQVSWSDSNEGTMKLTFGKWGEQVQVTAPSKSTSMKKVVSEAQQSG
jgi:hypothetical protein